MKESQPMSDKSEKPEALKPCGQCYKCLEGQTVDFGNGFTLPVTGTRLVVCVTCGNKRCPHATDCRLPCTGSNEPGQTGSIYSGPPPSPTP